MSKCDVCGQRMAEHSLSNMVTIGHVSSRGAWRRSLECDPPRPADGHQKRDEIEKRRGVLGHAEISIDDFYAESDHD